MPQWYGGSTLNPDDLIAPPEQWRDQWCRTQRWFASVGTLKRQAAQHELDANDLDTILAFFQNCYHLRDWISASRPDLANRLDDLFQSYFESAIRLYERGVSEIKRPVDGFSLADKAR